MTRPRVMHLEHTRPSRGRWSFCGRSATVHDPAIWEALPDDERQCRQCAASFARRSRADRVWDENMRIRRERAERERAVRDFRDQFGVGVVMVIDSAGEVLARSQSYGCCTIADGAIIDEIMDRRRRGEDCALVAHLIDYADHRLERVGGKWRHLKDVKLPIPGDPETRQVRVEEAR